MTGPPQLPAPTGARGNPQPCFPRPRPHHDLGISLWPWLVPFQVSFRQAAAAPESQSLLLVGTVIMLPVVLGYTAYCYYLFRGKASDEATY